MRAVLLAVILTVVFFLPLVTSAYSTTEQTAIRITDDTFLFSITYRLSFLNRDLLVPIVTTHASSGEVDTASKLVQYSFTNPEGEQVQPVQVGAIVGSGERIVDQQYSLDEGSAGFFTLYVIARFDDDTVSSEGGIKMQIDWLPFTMLEDGVPSAVRIPTESLVEYKTPHVTLFNQVVQFTPTLAPETIFKIPNQVMK